MKKLFTLMAAVAMTASASAQTVTESQNFDNIYVGVNVGAATKMTGQSGWLNGLNPNIGIRVGRYFTPVLGLAIESNAYARNKPYGDPGTLVRFLNTSLLGTVNLSNWFGGYKGEPRNFEVSALAGLGWGHLFGTKHGIYNVSKKNDRNDLTSKIGLDFAWNLGAAKAWQLYIEPSVIWGMNNNGFGTVAGRVENGPKFNINNAFAQVNVGLVYKFRNSNGTHNFTIAKLRDQSEIDALNAKISDLRNELAKKPKEVIREVVKEAPVVQQQEVRMDNLIFVTFAQGKSALTRDGKKALDVVPAGKHVQIVGTASPEGSKEINDRISQARADVVADYLKGKGVVVDEALGKGVQGTTSNRIAIVYVK